jgi:PPM family protein phosphatase
MILADLPCETQCKVLVLRQYQIATRSDIGLVRQGNEDNLYVANDDMDLDGEGVLVGVADGMGGHNAGEVASQVAAETLSTYYQVKLPELSPEERLAETIKRANDRIIEMSNNSLDLQGLGTTLTALLVKGREAYVGHVGDCRIYLWRKGQLMQITQDHSLVQEAVREGILTPEQARVHPQRNIITRALGTQDTMDVDTLRMDVQPGDIFLLSSDGLHGLLEDNEIEEIIRMGNGGLEQITEELITTALEEGGTDNVTVVLLKVPDESDGQPAAETKA